MTIFGQRRTYKTKRPVGWGVPVAGRSFTGSRVARVAAVLGVAAALGACSSSSKPASSGTTASSAASSASTGSSGSSTAATGAPIKVGLICTCSGTFSADLSPGVNVYKAWINTVNGSGGINGHPVQLVSEDDAGIPGTAITKAQALVADKVDAILDISITSSAWASTVSAANIPVVGGNSE